MRNFIGMVLITGFMGMAPIKRSYAPQIVRLQPVVVTAKRPDKGLQTFLHRMARIESDNNSHAVNRFGMLGKYQFHPTTLRSVGIRTSAHEFLNNERLQDTAMVRYMKSNAIELRGVIKKWSGKTYNGVRVTKSGILASAHLVGTVGVLAYFYPEQYSHRTVDANGTTVAMYMQKFGNLQLSF